MISPKTKFVVDTNVFISQMLFPNSTPGQAFQKALTTHIPLISEPLLEELTIVLSRQKFDPCLTIKERQEFLHHLSLIIELVPHVISIQACRDPKDDKVLSLAVSGKASFILTGDQDLPSLHPFQGIPILSCQTFLEENKMLSLLHEETRALR